MTEKVYADVEQVEDRLWEVNVYRPIVPGHQIWAIFLVGFYRSHRRAVRKAKRAVAYWEQAIINHEKWSQEREVIR